MRSSTFTDVQKSPYLKGVCWSTLLGVYPDQLYGGPSKNNQSGRQGDLLWANDGDNLDTLDGGGGYDMCVGDPGDRYVKCEFIDY